MGSPTQDLQHYCNVRDELHEAEGLLFLGDRVVVPKKLRPDMLQLIHEIHQGADKCKTRARPVLSQDIETIVGRCHICLKFRDSNPKEPLIPHDVPERLWQKVAADIMTFKSRDYIVAVDSYSKYPETALLEN